MKAVVHLYHQETWTATVQHRATLALITTASS